MSSQIWALVCALAAAFGYACGAVIQQRAVTAVTANPADPTSGLRSLAAILRSPWWVAGVALDAVGFGMEFLALRAGSLTLVQPLLVSGLLFALPLGALLIHHRVRPKEVGAGVLVCAGLTAFLLAAHPNSGSGPAPAAAWLAVVATTALVVGGLLLVSTGRGRAVRAVCYAASAGLVNGLFAALAKAVGITLRSGFLPVLTSWQPWVLAITAAATLTLAAQAFQAGAPSAAVATLFAIEPLSGVAVGVVLYGETLRYNPQAIAIEAAGLLVCLLGMTLLSRSPAVLTSYAAREPRPDNSSTPRNPAMAPVSEEVHVPPGMCSHQLDSNPVASRAPTRAVRPSSLHLSPSRWTGER